MNVFEAQLLLRPGETFAERARKAGWRVTLAEPPQPVTVEEFERTMRAYRPGETHA